MAPVAAASDARSTNPIGIDGVLESLTPPYVKSMDEAVDRCIEEKYGPAGTYGDNSDLRPLLQEERIRRCLPEDGGQAPLEGGRGLREGNLQLHLRHRTAGSRRTSNAFHLPGVWLQFSHLEMEFYDKYFDRGSLPPAGGTPRAVGGPLALTGDKRS